MANPRHLELLKRSIPDWNVWRQEDRTIQPDLTEADLRGANLKQADLSAANLTRATLCGADLFEADLYRANLLGADLSDAYLGAANLFATTLWCANLRRAVLSEANLSEAMLVHANLSGADLRWARLDRANLREANLTGCRVCGVSACNVDLERSKQAGLLLANEGDALTMDHLEMAQFIYLAQNTRIGDLFDSLVLLVGRFSGRGSVLTALKWELHALHYVPLCFDLDQASDTPLSISLARLARFLLLDVTGIRYVPNMRSPLVAQRILPIQPLLDLSCQPTSPCLGLDLSPWIRPLYRYHGPESLPATFKQQLIDPLEEAVQQW
jgi:hypothetical protein